MNGNAISQWIFELGLWPMIVMLSPNVFVFRKYGAKAARKRMASLHQAIAVFLITATASAVVGFELSDWYLLVGIIVTAGLVVLLRRRVFPYRLTCPDCGEKHNLLSAEFTNVYIMDDDLCDSCRKIANPEEDADPEPEIEADDDHEAGEEPEQ